MADKKKKAAGIVRRDYSPSTFKDSNSAYAAYQKDRFKTNENPSLAPRKKFDKIWTWDRGDVAKPGKR